MPLWLWGGLYVGMREDLAEFIIAPLMRRFFTKNCCTLGRLKQLLSLKRDHASEASTSADYILQTVAHIKRCRFCKSRAANVLETEAISVRPANKELFLSMLSTLGIDPKRDFHFFLSRPDERGKFLMEIFSEAVETQNYIDFLLGKHKKGNAPNS